MAYSILLNALVGSYNKFVDPSLLKYPKKSHRKTIINPPDSIMLAELMGILAGDGGVGNTWQITVSLNSERDKKFALHVKSLFEDLFGVSPREKKRPNQNTITITATSTTLVDFLISKGIPRGDKIRANIDIPFWIRENREYLKYFIRGLFDTDGCLYIHRHTIANKLYRNIGFCFTSYAKTLLSSFANTLKDFNINPHITDNGKRIYLYAETDVIKYLDIFGTSNPRIYSLYKQWRDSRVV